MREIIEFRIPEDEAKRYLPTNLGMNHGIVRIVKLDVDDPLLAEVRQLDRDFRTRGSALYTAWVSHRSYTPDEFARAALFHVWPKRVFEPAGEECGTIYDDTVACDHVFAPEMQLEVGGRSAPIPASTCGAGAQQMTPLFLDGRCIPKNVDFAATIADEIVVSDRVVEVFREHGLTGAQFESVRLSNAGGTPSADSFQLKVEGKPVEVDPATRAGEGPFDEESYGRCPRGHVVGLNLLSEVTVMGSTVSNFDVMATKQLVGVRRGLLRPHPILLLSPRAWRVVDDVKLKGLRVEVAHVV